MTPDILKSLLWRIRLGLRVDGMGLFAGHGFADPNYRPPRLPYVSVVGPLDLQRESERDPPRSVYLWVQSPGYFGGAERVAEDLVPSSGQIRVRLDGDATASIPVDFGALVDQPLNDDDTARQVSARIEQAVRNAVDDGLFHVNGIPVTDETRRKELRAATVRWDRHRRRVVISSGRRGPVSPQELSARQPSRVEVLDDASDVGLALGFGANALAAEGRIVRHRVPNPLGVAVDVRFDLWAGSQRDLATVMDAWARITPTRGQLLVRPALLAEDVSHGSSAIRLQSSGESPTPWTLAQFEPDGGFADRLGGRSLDFAGGATVDLDEDLGALTLRFTGAATAATQLFEESSIPYPWRPEHPGPGGYAVSLGLKVDGGAQTGQSFCVLTLEHGLRSVLRLEVHYVTANGQMHAELWGSAQQASGEDFAAAASRVDATTLEESAEIHAVVDARRGAVLLFLNGVPLPSEPGETAPGTPAGGSNMRLTIGDPAGTPVGFRITHLQVHGRPLGPVDPNLRETAYTANSWSVGDPIGLVRTENGASGSGEPFLAVVSSLTGDMVSLDRPVQGDWPRGGTLAFMRSLFFSQKQLRRRDDLINNLYRIAIEYRVSAFLEERYPSVSAPLVEEIPHVQIRELSRVSAEQADPMDPAYPVRPAPGRPGVKTVIA